MDKNSNMLNDFELIQECLTRLIDVEFVYKDKTYKIDSHCKTVYELEPNTPEFDFNDYDDLMNLNFLDGIPLKEQILTDDFCIVGY